MKKILAITMICTFTHGFAQPELDTFDKKDMIEKMDRADLDMESKDDVKIDDSILKFDIPKIEFDVPVKNPKRTVANTTSKAKKVVKKPAVEAAPVATAPVVTTPAKKEKPKVVFARRPISIGQMKKNDKIVLTNGVTYVYRLQKSNVIQFKFNGKIPFDSKGLRKNDETSYYIVNKNSLVADYRKLRSSSKKPNNVPQVAAVKKPSEVKTPAKAPSTKVSSTEAPTAINKDQKPDNQVLQVDVVEKRKAIEEKYNNGRSIKKSIKLRGLRENDEVFIVGGIQFVFRKISSNSVKKKYWLTEKLDIDNKAVKKTGNNKYKIIRFYKP